MLIFNFYIFFLIFNQTKNFNNKIKFAYYNTFFLSLSAYFTPNFAFFSIFFLYNFFLIFKLKKEIFNIILLNIILATPAIYFLIAKDFYLFNSEVYQLDNSIKYNLSNKIIIISSILLLFFIPFVSKNNLLNNIKKVKIDYNIFILLCFISINIYFYNFLDNAGGGIFYHLSQLLIGNSLILFVVFIFALCLFKYLNLFNLNNIFLFIVLVFYNLQFTIYYKYFEPLVFFLFLFLFNHKNLLSINLNTLSKKYFFFYLFFLLMNFGKSLINY